MDNSNPHTHLGECPRCGFVTELSGGLITHHKRLRRRKWLPCPGIAQKPKPLTFRQLERDMYASIENRVEQMKRVPMTVVDRRSSSAVELGPLDGCTTSVLDMFHPDNDTTRYYPGPDPDDPTGPAVILDRLTGEVVYRKK